MAGDGPSTSALRRFVKLSGLMGRVGGSVLAERLVELALSSPAQRLRRTENLVKNAVRIAETLGEMKGAVMKVGQMLSLHQGLLPPEVSEVLRSLQQDAPRVPAEVMRFEVEGALGQPVSELFAELDEEAYAAASIGQVHLGKMRDGRRVAVKIQYPCIDEIIKADLGNLKRLLQSLFALVTDVDFEPVWEEVRDRLMEELDYLHEAENMRRMAELHRDVSEVIIPAVVTERTTHRVLTMEFLAGIPPDEACSDRYPQDLRDRWGRVLFELQLRGLLQHRFLHADPNLANFSFLEDGRVIVYDFGCIKEIPEPLAKGYARLFRTALGGRREEIPAVLRDMGVSMAGKSRERPLPRDLTDPYLDLFSELLRESPPYTFGEDPQLYDKLIRLGAANWSRAVDIRFPKDIVFVDRAMAGHFGNLARLHATGPWRDLVSEAVASTLEEGPAKGRRRGGVKGRKG